MPRRNKKAQLTPAAMLKRRRVWRHNGLRGSVAMAKNAMVTISQIDSTTPEAKQQALKIWKHLDILFKALKERVDES